MHWWYNRFPFNKIQLNCQFGGNLFDDNDAGDIVLLVTWSWRPICATKYILLVYVSDRYLILMPCSWCWWRFYQWWIVTLTNIKNLSPTRFVTNIRYQHWCILSVFLSSKYNSGFFLCKRSSTMHSSYHHWCLDLEYLWVKIACSIQTSKWSHENANQKILFVHDYFPVFYFLICNLCDSTLLFFQSIKA